jgi:hypothetical protein
MRTRADRITCAEPMLGVALDLREAFAVGTVLSRVQGKTPDAHRARAAGARMLEFAENWTLKKANGILAELEGAIDAKTEVGKKAQQVAQGLKKALEGADQMGEERGRWVERGEEGEATNGTNPTKGGEGDG